MHSVSNRFQSVFGYFTTVAFVLGLLTAVSVVLHPAEPKTSLELTNIQVIKGRPHYYATKREEYAQIRFDLDADLSSLFNWNTKQLFVYVLASYPSFQSLSAAEINALAINATTTSTTESIIWDTIIPAPTSPYSLESLKTHVLSLTSSQKPNSKSKSKAKSKSKQNEKDGKGKAPGVLKLRNQKQKYQITDISGHMAENANATLVIGWNVQPWIGALQWNDGSNMAGNLGGNFGKMFIHSGGIGGRSKPFDFPPLKKKTSSTSSTS